MKNLRRFLIFIADKTGIRTFEYILLNFIVARAFLW